MQLNLKYFIFKLWKNAEEIISYIFKLLPRHRNQNRHPVNKLKQFQLLSSEYNNGFNKTSEILKVCPGRRAV